MVKDEGRPETCGRSGQAINLVSVQSAILETFRRGTGLATILRARTQTGDFFRRNYFSCGKSDLISTIFPNIPVTSLYS